MYTFYTLLKRDMVNIFLNPMLLSYNTAFPFLLMLVLGSLNRGSYGNTGINSYDYYGVTILLYIVLNVSTTAANSFMERSLKTTNLRVMFSPIRNSYIYLSKIAATFIFTSVCFVVLMLLSGALLGVNYGGRNALPVLALVLLFDLLSAVIGVFFCCIFKSEELTNKILSLVNNLFAILGGLFFQMGGLGRTVEVISGISPAKWVSEGIFRMIYDNDLSFFLPISAIFLALSGILLMGCKLTFKTEDYV
jgi:ABC-2 type transport system permease protein